MLAKEGAEADVAKAVKDAAFMNIPEDTDEEIPFEEIDNHPELQVKPEDVAPARTSRRRRRV